MTDELRAKFASRRKELESLGYRWSETKWEEHFITWREGYASRDAEVEALKRDVERFHWMVFHGAKVYWGNDGEVCHVEWFDEAEEELRKTSNYFDAREAIDAAMAKDKS